MVVNIYRVERGKMEPRYYIGGICYLAGRHTADFFRRHMETGDIAGMEESGWYFTPDFLLQWGDQIFYRPGNPGTPSYVAHATDVPKEEGWIPLAG